MTTPYSRDPEALTAIPGTLELADPYAELRSVLTDLAAERTKVTLHVMGGMRVQGKIMLPPGQTEVNSVVSLKSSGVPHHVPVHMIVVVEEEQ